MIQATASNIVLKRIENELERRTRELREATGINLVLDDKSRGKKRDGAQTLFVKGEIVSIGPKYAHDTMTFLKPGDTVLFNPFDADEWEDMLIVNGGAVVAKLTE